MNKNTSCSKEIPIHKHDCAACIFLGTYQGEDLYVCPAGRVPTVISRYGIHGEYSSGMCFSYGQGHRLTEARLRAEKQGIIKVSTCEEDFL